MMEDSVIQMAEMPKEVRDQRGQFISFVLLIDQVLEEIIANLDDEDKISSIATNKYFYSLMLGLTVDDPNYRDALLPVAAFGPEMVIAAHLGTTPPPDTEEDLWWPEGLPLPEKLNGFSLADGIYTRDRNRDAAVVHSLLDGSNVRQPNNDRLGALMAIMMIAMEVGPEAAADVIATQLGMAMWHNGNHEDGLAVMRALEKECDYKGTRGAWLANHYESKYPSGPLWVQIMEMRDKY